MNQTNYTTICQKVLQDLEPRQKQVLERRFGLKPNQEQETLQAIGQDFEVTRERIRQIQNNALHILQNKQTHPRLQQVFAHFQDKFQQHGGLKREDSFLKNLTAESQHNQVRFLLALGQPFIYQSQTEDFYLFWALDKKLTTRAKQGIRTAFKVLEKQQQPLAEQDIFERLPTEQATTGASILEIAKKIEKGPLGGYGLVSWPEINPRGARDRAYLALKKEQRPLHFREIAQVANELQEPFNNSGKVLSQTVHNELIKDDRFVLVGRGTYALRNWGYKEGNVKDVITRILEQEGNPLSQHEIVEQVLKQRVVQANTVLLNLRDNDMFRKNAQGKYIVKNA